MFSLRRISAAWGLFAFVGLGGASGCLYDSSNRCDPGQTYDSEAGLCVCAGNTITGDRGCVACGAHQHRPSAPDAGELAPDMCVCDDGYQQMTSGGECVIVPQGLGDPCKTDDDCSAKGAFTTCQMSAVGGYCTNTGCASNDDCAGGYACNTASTPAYCQRPPVGQGMACTSSTDCAGTEAPYCLTIMANICFVECTPTGNECFSGYQCCDLNKLSGGLIPKQLCVPDGTCHT